MSPWEDLDPEQREAVEHFLGPAVVNAGPGSGKTRVVVLRAVRLLQLGVPAEKIALVTFTRKAAREMRSRLQELVGEGSKGVWISTFHGLAYTLLRRAFRFVLLDRDGAEKLLWTLGLPRKFSQEFLSAIGYLKNTGATLEETLALHPELSPRFETVLSFYEEAKERQGLLDFDDLMPKALELVRKHPGLVAEFAPRFTFTTVDEFQDTSPVQAQLLYALLPERPPNLMLVGDPDQAIYSWRGGSPTAFGDVLQDGWGARYTLSTNYRSHEGIVGAVRTFMGGTRLLKAPRPGPAPYRVVARTREEEADFIAQAVWRHANDRGVPYGEMAVLVRAHWYTSVLEKAFFRYQIPYVLVGKPFWKREEVALLIDLLAGVLGDEAAYRRVSEHFLPHMTDVITPHYVHFSNLFFKLRELLKEAAAYRGRALAARIREAWEPLRTLFEPVLRSLALRQGGDFRERLRNLEEALNELQTLAGQDPEFRLEDFVNGARLAAQEIQGSDQDGVRIMTVHAAKGLEFSVVFVAGITPGVFPSRKAGPTGQAEERRLLYVAMTRAKEYLYLSSAEAHPGGYLEEVPGERLDYDPGVGFLWPEDQWIIQGLGGKR